jgi:2-polyprenyl-6-methoxyphenol hydroxylase-like FAD-dependent oxidoreductase
MRVDTVVGSGVAGLACALFAAQHGPVRLYGGRARQGSRSLRRPGRVVESVPAATLTLLLELGLTPSELDVGELRRDRVVAWDADPRAHTGPVCAHIDRVALHAALWERVTANPAITVVDRAEPDRAASGWVDATGRRALSARTKLRPPRTWTASTVTVGPGRASGFLRFAAAPDGYAYRLGSARWTTVGWVGPGRPPRDAASLRHRIDTAGCGWLLEGCVLASAGPPDHRSASTSIPVPGACAGTAIGDAALTRDALASQGVSLALSDACIVADPQVSRQAMVARTVDARSRHIQHMAGMVTSCRYADTPTWTEYAAWLDGLAY